MDTKNLAVIRHSFAQAVFNHKIQEVIAESFRKKSKVIKISNIILVALCLVFIVVSLSRKEEIWMYLSISISIVDIIFLVIQLFFSFDKNENFHSNSANKFLNLRDRYKILIADVMSNDIDIKNLRKVRDELQNQYSNICEISPKIEVANHYITAQKKLGIGKNRGEEFTWSDEEIDRFLPEDLRLKK